MRLRGRTSIVYYIKKFFSFKNVIVMIALKLYLMQKKLWHKEIVVNSDCIGLLNVKVKHLLIQTTKIL